MSEHGDGRHQDRRSLRRGRRGQQVSSEIRLYKVGGRSVFQTNKGPISYLVVWHGGMRLGFSYGFRPTSPAALRYAKRNFAAALLANKAARFDPDGGRLDGKDLK